MGTWPVNNTVFLVVVIEPKWCVCYMYVCGGGVGGRGYLHLVARKQFNSVESLSSHPRPRCLLFSGVWSRLEMTRWMRYFSDFMSFAC